MKISIIFAEIFCGSLFAIIPLLLAILHKKKKLNVILSTILLIMYSLLLIVGVFSSVRISSNYISFHFETYGTWFNKEISYSFYNSFSYDFWINLVMLFPYGVILTNLVKKKKIVKSLLLGLLIGFTIEALQFSLPINRSVQLFDVIFNSISCLLGSIYYLIIYKIICKK